MNAAKHDRAHPNLHEYIPLREVAGLLPQREGKPLHRSTILRWAMAGVSGVRLRTICMGRIRCTTISWLNEFAEQVDEARHPRQAGGAPK